MRVSNTLRLLLPIVFALALPVLPALAAQFKTAERVKHYTVTGTTGPELYASIGENGPRISGGGARLR